MAEGDPSPPLPATKWFDGFDDATKNYITQRGLADKDPLAAFQETAKAHLEAQAYIGVPKEQLLKLPKADAPPEEWDAVYERLGYSKDPNAYKFEGLKFEDGTEVEDGFKDFLRQQAADLKLSPAAATRFAEAQLKFLAGADAAESATTTAEATRALEALRNNWGPNYEANKVIADRAYAAIMAAAGFDQAKMTTAIQQLTAATGRSEAMEMLLAIGQRMGEDTFRGSGGPSGGPQRYTGEQAKARIAELKGDSEFVKRYLAGGTTEGKEMADLHLIAYPADA